MQLPRVLGVVGAGQMGAGIAQVIGHCDADADSQRTSRIAMHPSSPPLSSLVVNTAYLPPQVAAVAGLDVLLMDTSGPALDRARDGIAASLQRAVGKKKLAADVAEAALARIAPHREMEVRASPALVSRTSSCSGCGRAHNRPELSGRRLSQTAAG